MIVIKNTFDVRVHEHWPPHAEMKFVRVHEHSQFGNKFAIFAGNFFQHYCYLHIPTYVSYRSHKISDCLLLPLVLYTPENRDGRQVQFLAVFKVAP